MIIMEENRKLNSNQDILINLKRNIISWYPIKENQTVLQVGSDDVIFNELKNKTNNVKVVDEKNIANEKKNYDFVVIIGVFEQLKNEEEIKSLLKIAKNKLTADGKILLAMQNKFGMKYWTGERAQEDLAEYETIVSSKENILSLPKIKEILNEFDLKFKFYYPLPDYKFTNVIYTDEFMPDDESIDSRILTLCEDDEILNFSEREAYKQILKEDKNLFPFFSNSYFIEVCQKDDFKNIKFVSYGFLRNSQYQIKTIIDGEKVYKYANQKEADEHIKNMSDIFQVLNNANIDYIGKYCNNHIETNFLKNAKSFDKVLIDIYYKEGLQKTIEKIKEFKTNVLDKLLNQKGNCDNDVFDKYNVNIPSELKKKLNYTENGVIDLIFQNFLVQNDVIYAYDQEWFEKNVPLEFILYRAILYFNELKEKKDIEAIYQEFNLTEYILYFKELDDKIQAKIINQDIWNKYINIAKNIGTAHSILRNYEKEKELTDRHIENLQNNLDMSNVAIKQYQEDIRASNIHIKNIENELESKTKILSEYETGIQQLRNSVDELNVMINTKDAEILDYANQLRNISNSFSWKITKPIRILSWFLNPFSGASFLDRILPPGSKKRIEYDKKQAEKKYAEKLANYFRLTDEKTAEFWQEIDAKKNSKYVETLKRKENNQCSDYEKWILNNEPTNQGLEMQIKKKFKKKPKISIVVPLYKTDTKFFRELLYSVHCQTYSNWELCLADGSPEPLTEIKKMCEKDERIKYKFLGENKGISENTNKALALATGDYIGLLDHDDFLSEDCLFEVVNAINENPKIEFIYTDEDKASGLLEERYDAYFKPDFSPDTLLSQNYICHFSVFKKEIMDKLGGFRSDYDGAQDYDIFLRMSEIVKPENIKHIAKVLYHWRIHKESTAMQAEAKPWAFEAGRNAIENHLQRMEIKATVNNGKALGTYEVEYEVQGNPKVSILIPNKDEIEVLKVCIDSILKLTTYENYEIIVIENNSTEKETFDFYKKIEKKEKIKVIYYKEKGFNYSKIINFGVRNSDGDFVIQLNNDTELLTPDWLQKMVGYARKKRSWCCAV